MEVRNLYIQLYAVEATLVDMITIVARMPVKSNPSKRQASHVTPLIRGKGNVTRGERRSEPGWRVASR